MLLWTAAVIVLLYSTAVVMLVPLSCNKAPPQVSPPVTVPLPMGSPPGTPGAAADDIVTPPGGFTYRANVHQQGQTDWPPIRQTDVSLRSLLNIITVRYRDYIETKAGQTRNNIFFLKTSGLPPMDPLKVQYEAVGVPEGIYVERVWTIYGGIGGMNRRASNTLLMMRIAPEVVPGEHTFAIEVKYGWRDFGSIPCTVKVTQ